MKTKAGSKNKKTALSGPRSHLDNIRSLLASNPRLCGSAMLLAIVGCEAPEQAAVVSVPSSLVSKNGITAQVPTDSSAPIRIALTYDDGPDKHSLELAEYLHKQGVRATFFVNGRRLGGKQNPDLQPRCQLHESPYPHDDTTTWDESYLEKILDLGHRIGNHTLDHCDLESQVSTKASADLELLRKEVSLNQDILDRHIRDGVKLIRYPYGDGAGDETVADQVNLAAANLFGSVSWDHASGDFSCSDTRTGPAPRTPMECADASKGKIETMANMNRRMIVLDHDRLEFNTGSTYALELAQVLVPWMKSKGYALTPLEGVVAPDALLPRSNDAPAFASSRLWSQAPDFQAPVTGHPDWSSSPSYYRTIQITDINGDGDGDLCGRWDDGIYCALSSGARLGSLTKVYGGDFTDAVGWRDPSYGSTVQLVDINGDGKVDICGRGIGGVACALQGSEPASFGSGAATLVTPAFSDSFDMGHFNLSDPYYGSLHFADVNGDRLVDICGRASDGVRCVTATKGADGTVRFAPPTLWSSEFSDGNGWSLSQYGSTLQFADIDGDGKADVCGRGGGGMVCALSTGCAFGSPSKWTPGGEFSDGVGWSSALYYRSLRLVDVNGDGKADACGRGIVGVVCTLSKAVAGVGSGFSEPAIPMLRDFSDGSFAAGSLAADSATLQFGELNQGPNARGERRFPDVCMLWSGKGLYCATNKQEDFSLDFGGAFGYVDGGTLAPNPATSLASCPSGYTDTKVLDTVNVDWPVHFCSSPHLTGAAPAYDFGGMWGYVNYVHMKNPITGTASCPVGYTDQKLLGTFNVDYDLHACYKAHVAGTTPEHAFGGMWGYVNGKPTRNPATGAPSCPVGYTDTKVLDNINVDYAVHFCWY